MRKLLVTLAFALLVGGCSDFVGANQRPQQDSRIPRDTVERDSVELCQECEVPFIN